MFCCKLRKTFAPFYIASSKPSVLIFAMCEKKDDKKKVHTEFRSQLIFDHLCPVFICDWGKPTDFFSKKIPCVFFGCKKNMFWATTYLAVFLHAGVRRAYKSLGGDGGPTQGRATHFSMPPRRRGSEFQRPKLLQTE